MAAANPAERKEIASIGAHARWGNRTDQVAPAPPGRAAMRARLDSELPDDIVDPDVRRVLVDHRLKEWMIRARHRRRRQDRVIDAAIRILNDDGAA